MKKATEEIEQRIKEIEKKKLNNQKRLGSVGMGLKYSLDLISPIIVGILIGLGFDKFFLTKPIFFLFFLVLGIVAGFMNIIKSMKKLK
jgi:ATP synthase protein I|tara:strand:- start:865 stop:1128 length:264 start_codon:yes stop_codon:yes gene_type:complete